MCTHRRNKKKQGNKEQKLKLWVGIQHFGTYIDMCQS
jgi:hypothetical protein